MGVSGEGKPDISMRFIGSQKECLSRLKYNKIQEEHTQNTNICSAVLFSQSDNESSFQGRDLAITFRAQIYDEL